MADPCPLCTGILKGVILRKPRTGTKAACNGERTCPNHDPELVKRRDMFLRITWSKFYAKYKRHLDEASEW